MIGLGTKGKKFGFAVCVGYHRRFISMGDLDTMTDKKMRMLLNKARKLEMALMGVEEKAPMTISNFLRSNGRVKHIHVSKGKVKLALPNCNGKSITLKSWSVDVDAQYLTTRIFNHYNFNDDGMTFQVVKSLVKSQLYAAL